MAERPQDQLLDRQVALLGGDGQLPAMGQPLGDQPIVPGPALGGAIMAELEVCPSSVTTAGPSGRNRQDAGVQGWDAGTDQASESGMVPASRVFGVPRCPERAGIRNPGFGGI